MALRDDGRRRDRPRRASGTWARSSAGFTLAEAVVAAGLLAGVLVGLSYLLALAAHANAGARRLTLTAVLAQQKIDQLRSLTWSLEEDGRRAGDVTADTAVAPIAPTGGSGLSPSPAGTLARDTPGYVDYLDAAGQSLGGGGARPGGTAFVRRWAIAASPVVQDVLVIQVLVAPLAALGAQGAAPTAERVPGVTRIVTARARRPR